MRFSDRSSSWLLTVGFLILGSNAIAETESHGLASCKRPGAGQACLTAWDFSRAPREYYWIERFVHADNIDDWQTIAGPFSSERVISDSTVEGGYLYRVVGCNDESRATDCLGSTVYWAPLRPVNVESIPDRIDTPEGYYLRHRNLSELEQVINYNRAILRKLVLEIDMTSMPPMTPLPFDDLGVLPDGVDVDDATIDYNLQSAYPYHI